MAGARIVNLFADDWRPGEQREGYASRERRLGALLGAEKMGATLYELGPGERICPYHFEFAEEEWLLVLSGTPTIRTPEGEQTLRAWDVVAFLRGPRGAHEVRNDADQALVVMMLSTLEPLGVVVYPDSGKVSAYAQPIGEGELVQIRNRPEANLDYWDGES